MKYYILFLWLCLNSVFVIAIRPTPKKQNNHIKIIKATVSNEDNTIRKNGDVYQFTIVSNTNHVIIDSVLIKNRPVPVDVYELVKRKRIQACNKGDTVLITAAKNYYENIGDPKKVKPLPPIKGEAKIYYKVGAKRYYYIVSKVDREESKRKMR